MVRLLCEFGLQVWSVLRVARCECRTSQFFAQSLNFASYTSIRLLCYNTYTRLIFAKIYTQVNTTHEDERRTLRQLCKLLYKGHKIARQHSKAQRRIPYPYKDSGDQRHRTQTCMNSSVLRPLGPLEIVVGSPCRPLTYPRNR